MAKTANKKVNPKLILILLVINAAAWLWLAWLNSSRTSPPPAKIDKDPYTLNDPLFNE